MRRNTIVLQQGRTASRWQFDFLKSLGFKVAHEPIGGWQERGFDEHLSWSHYLNTRMSCRPSNFPDKISKSGNLDLREAIQATEFIEVGYASLPFAINIPCDWRILGVIRHPQTWVYSAMHHKFYKNHFEKDPKTCEDFAKLWYKYNSLIWKRAERVYRMEDLMYNCDMFAQEFEYYKPIEVAIRKPAEYTTPFCANAKRRLIEEDNWKDWWSIVQPLAEKLGYDPIEKKCEPFDFESGLSK